MKKLSWWQIGVLIASIAIILLILGLGPGGRAMERLGDAPIEPKYVEQMNALAHGLDVIFNDNAKGNDRKVGFVLMVFAFGDEGRCNYISNGADRKDIVTLMKEMIARFEGQPEMKGRA